MKVEVSKSIEELKRQFPSAELTIREDGHGGAMVIVEPVSVGGKYNPHMTWVGFHITAQYPYADIYPIFIGAEIKRVDGREFQAPVTHGHQFEGRPAIQVSRRSGAAQNGLQRATTKILKILDFLERLE
ncbi:hypothetical protein [Nitrospira moscoviensis]|uniref:hypothetical protein n=1 Tax=Nitrospira moscoviensis TaxID=42253 RepID=UPI0006A7D33B|nr:hypothetical protein [Nitrospira moscoviensis]